MIRAGQSPSERQKTMDDWNSPHTNMDVLILNSAVSSAGLNCHYQCSVGIGLSFVWNVSTVTQFVGRIVRIGQKKSVRWYMPHINGTIDNWQEEKMFRKVRSPFLQ
jgi:SNF2 family DNA or RNA helicase